MRFNYDISTIINILYQLATKVAPTDKNIVCRCGPDELLAYLLPLKLLKYDNQKPVKGISVHGIFAWSVLKTFI